MTTAVSQPRRERSAPDLVVSILLMVVGLVVLVLEGILDVLLALTSADSPGDVEGAVGLAFTLLAIGGIAWLVAIVLAIILLVRRRPTWWLALLGVLVPLGCAVGGFLAVTSVVQ
jgi:hypothetical protein